MSHQSITLGGGCFWCLEAVYEQVEGVTAVESGYSNGHVKNPSYEQVCNGHTGHAEVVRVESAAEIAQAGVVFAPGLAIDGELMSTGAVVPVERIVEWIKAAA